MVLLHLPIQMMTTGTINYTSNKQYKYEVCKLQSGNSYYLFSIAKRLKQATSTGNYLSWTTATSRLVCVWYIRCTFMNTTTRLHCKH